MKQNYNLKPLIELIIGKDVTHGRDLVRPMGVGRQEIEASSTINSIWKTLPELSWCFYDINLILS